MLNKLITRFGAVAVFICTTVALNAQTTLPTSWNFSTPGIASPPNGWTTGLGTNGNLTYSFGVGDAISCRFDATGEFLTIQFTDKPGPLSYYLSPQNAGGPFGGQFDIQESSNGSNWTTVRSITSKATTATNFTNGKYTDNLLSTSRYVRFYFTSKLPGGQPTPGGNMALDSVLIQQAPPPVTPVINVKQAATTIVSNSTYVVGNAVSTVFTIENKGTQQTLKITGYPITGADGAAFSITSMPDSIVAGGSGQFTLNFNPVNAGSYHATLTLQSNDPDKGSFPVNLYGIGGSYATEPVAGAGSVTIRNVKAYGFDVLFTQPATKPEGYIVLRKKGSAVTETPADGQTYKRGDYIGAAQVAYVGTDTAFRPTYIFAGTDYYFAVVTFNGPAGFENYRTTNVSNGHVHTAFGDPGNYYTGLDPLDSTFVGKLSQRINPHDTVFYSLYIARMVNNYLTRDTTGGKKVVNCVYTTIPHIYDEPFIWWSGSNSGILTREHTYAQSWMPSNQGGPWPYDPVTGKELPEYNDLHNLFPADQINGNQKRSNYPFGEVTGAVTFVSPTGLGKLGKDAGGNTVWEPRNEQKGDLARALFYMVTSYNGVKGKAWALPSGQDQAVLKKWHFQDLPDAFEQARHELIYDQQHNRNPFIDNPNYACRINFSNMSWISNPAGNCAIAQIAVTYPNTNYVNVGDVHMLNIQWTSSLVDSVRIQCQVNDTGLVDVIGSTPAVPGSYNWGIPANLFNDSLRIIITARDNGSIMDQSTKFFLTGGVGINHVQAEEIAVYPNPSQGMVNLDMRNVSGDKFISVYNLQGQLLFTQKISGPHGSVELQQKGVYLLQVQSGKTTIHCKVIVF